MEKLTFAEVTKIEGVVGITNSLVSKYAAQLGLATTVSLPSQIINASEFRIKVERVHGTLVDIAKFHATSMYAKLVDVSEQQAADIVEQDKEFNQIIETIVSLNGVQGMGHQTIHEIAKLTSKQPNIIARVRNKLERKVRETADKFAREGRIVMDVIRHSAVPQKQCLFSA